MDHAKNYKTTSASPSTLPLIGPLLGFALK